MITRDGRSVIAADRRLCIVKQIRATGGEA